MKSLSECAKTTRIRDLPFGTQFRTQEDIDNDEDMIYRLAKKPGFLGCATAKDQYGKTWSIPGFFAVVTDQDQPTP